MEMTLIGPDLAPRGRVRWLSCTIVQKLNSKGTFTAQIAAETLTASRVIPGCRLFIRDPEAGSFSVLITTIERSGTQSGVTNLNLSGVDELVALDSRITYPSPDREASQQTAAEYYQDSGPAGAVIASMVLRNAGGSALAARRWKGLQVNPSTAGGQVSVKTRFKSLLDESKALAELGKVRMVCRYRTTRQITFSVDPIVDRSRSMVFRQTTGTLGDWTVSLTGPETTTFILGGQGEGTARLVKSYDLAASDTWGWRVETFKDQTDAENASALDKAGTDQVAVTAGSAAVSMTVNEVPGRGVPKVFNRDYHIGDIVTARLGGINYTDQIQQAEINWSETGRETKLTIGRSQDQENNSPAWVRRVRALDAAQKNLETR